MSTIPAHRRRSPLVRRLLEQHEVAGRSIPGTGTGGRVRPDDVLVAAGLPWPATDGALLASPAARRRLRDAGASTEQVRSAGLSEPVTLADVERFLASGPPTSHPAPESQRAPEAPEAPAPDGALTVLADLSALVQAAARARDQLVAQDGTEPGLAAYVATVAAALLARPDTTAVVGVHLHGDTAARPVEGAAGMTVAGLARRARATDPADGPVAVSVTADATAPLAALAGASEHGVVLVGAPEDHDVVGTDEHGRRVVRTIPHLPLHLLPGTDPADGDAWLRSLAADVGGWRLPVV